MQFTWIGWPGQDVSAPFPTLVVTSTSDPSTPILPILTLLIQIPMKDRQQVEDHLLNEFNCYPVYLSDELADRHYNGFSNSILWPLFHYHPGEMNFDEDNWLAYR